MSGISVRWKPGERRPWGEAEATHAPTPPASQEHGGRDKRRAHSIILTKEEHGLRGKVLHSK